MRQENNYVGRHECQWLLRLKAQSRFIELVWDYVASFPGPKRRRRKDLFLLFGLGNKASLGPNPECLIYPPLPMVLLSNHNLGVCGGHAHGHGPQYHCCG